MQSFPMQLSTRGLGIAVLITQCSTAEVSPSPSLSTTECTCSHHYFDAHKSNLSRHFEPKAHCLLVLLLSIVSYKQYRLMTRWSGLELFLCWSSGEPKPRV